MPEKARIYIITARRPEMLQRCLDGLVRSGGGREVVISDDSRDPACERENESICVRFAALYAGVVRYMGSVERQNAVSALGAMDGERLTALDILLNDPLNLRQNTAALNRNLVALDAAGGPYISLDDDVLPSTAAFSADESERDLNGPSTYFFDSRAALLKMIGPSDKNPFDEHEAAFENEAHSVLTCPGLVGDNCWRSPLPLLFLGEYSRRRLLASDRTYSSATKSREIARTMPPLLVNPEHHFVTFAFGCCARTQLPPFLNIVGEDGIFAQMAAATSKPVFKGVDNHLPHLPEPARHYPPHAMLAGAFMLSFHGFFRSILSAILSSFKSSDVSLPAVAAELERLGRSPDRLWVLAREATAREAAELILQIETLLAEFPHCKPFQTEGASFISTLSRNCRRPEFCVPAEAYQSGSDPAAITASLVGNFGLAVRIWPTFFIGPRQRISRSLSGCG